MSEEYANSEGAKLPSNAILRESYSKDASEYSRDIMIFLVYFLKFFTDEEHPMLVKDIAELVEIKFKGVLFPKVDKNGKVTNGGQTKVTRTIRNHLNDYFDLKARALDETNKDNNAKYTFDILAAMFGGTIEKIGKARNLKYYFKPTLDKSDLMLIESSLISNRNLLDVEREHLMKGIDRLVMPNECMKRDNDLGNFHLLPASEKLKQARQYTKEDKKIKKMVADAHNVILSMMKAGVPEEMDPVRNPLFNRNYLNHIHILDEAIRKGYQVKTQYGKIEMKGKKSSLTFTYKRNKDKYSILNPYAIFSHRGNMYLVATVAGYDNPVHYRVDRIMTLEILTDDKDRPVGREDVPSALRNYIKNKKFDERLYVIQHPMMGIYDQNDRCRRYILRTTTNGLSILHDHFGENIDRVTQSVGKDGKKIQGEPNEYGYAPYYYDVMVKDVFENNMLLFLTHHHDMITILEPQDLRDRLVEKLRKSLESYEADSEE